MNRCIILPAIIYATFSVVNNLKHTLLVLAKLRFKRYATKVVLSREICTLRGNRKLKTAPVFEKTI